MAFSSFLQYSERDIKMMKIVTVIPIARGIFHDYLTYFSAQELTIGDLVTVPLRQKSVSALVIKLEPLESAKAGLRRGDYRIKKIGQVQARRFLPEATLLAAQAVADYSAAPLGQVLKSLLPKVMLLRGTEQLSGTQAAKIQTKSTEQSGAGESIVSEKLAIQDTDEERLSYYKGLIREALAKKESVLVIEPSVSDLLASQAVLERGIDHYTVILHGQMSEKILTENWDRACSDQKPLLIIATPNYLAIPRSDLATIIIDRESASTYRSLTRPYVDYRRFAEALASARYQKLVFGDILLRPETMHRLETRELQAAQAPRQRLPNASHIKLISVTSGEIWSNEARELLERTQTTHEHLLLLTNRRGFSPLIICDDCGESVACNNCGSPLVLHRARVKQGIQETTLFRCHHCGETRTSEEKCVHCDSWRLRALGTGIDRVAKELETLAPERSVFQLDSDQVKSSRAAQALVNKFLATPGAILLGTEMALNYLHDQVTHSIVITVDSMLAVPDFRINERLFNILARLRAITDKELIIQTRQRDNEALSAMARGHLLDFYRREIAERERFDYPPFKVFIKITRVGQAATLRATFQKLTEVLADYDPVIYPSLHQPGRGLAELNLLLKLKPSAWPDPTLSEKLKSLPSDYIVVVDPETIL